MHNCIVRLGFWNSMRKVNFEEFFKDSILRYFWGGEFCFKVLNTFRVTWDISSFSPIFTERKDHVTCNLNVQKTRWHYLQQKKGEENVSFFCNDKKYFSVSGFSANLRIFFLFISQKNFVLTSRNISMTDFCLIEGFLTTFTAYFFGRKKSYTYYASHCHIFQ